MKKKDTIAKGFRIERPVLERFIAKCKQEARVQSRVVEGLIELWLAGKVKL